jgi:hypothetical protein
MTIDQAASLYASLESARPQTESEKRRDVERLFIALCAAEQAGRDLSAIRQMFKRGIE